MMVRLKIVRQPLNGAESRTDAVKTKQSIEYSSTVVIGQKAVDKVTEIKTCDLSAHVLTCCCIGSTQIDKLCDTLYWVLLMLLVALCSSELCIRLPYLGTAW
eukprot:2646675-Amphidinium_carterae.1